MMEILISNGHKQIPIIGKKILSTIMKIQISKKLKEAERFITSIITIVITRGHQSRKIFKAISWHPDRQD